MALSASTVFEINSSATASNVNAGGFNPGNANMLTDLAADTNTGNTDSPVVSSASYNFVAGDVGHWVYIKAGTNWTPGWYQIASVASNKATLSAAVGAAIQVNNNRYGTNSAAGCATTGTPTGGTWSVDYSQSTSSPFSSTDLSSTNGNSNPAVIQSTANPFGKNMIGNLVHITAGTNWTQGWYEITNINAFGGILDRAVGTAATLSNGTGKVGGALSLGSSDDAVFELAVSSSSASARFFFKGNATYTISGNVSVSASGNAQWPVVYEGYVSTRGDRPSGSTRPVLAFGSNTCTLGNTTNIYNVAFTSTDANGISLGTGSLLSECKVTNKGTSTSCIGFLGNTNTILYRCEAICYRGAATKIAAAGLVDSCYFHDSRLGLIISGAFSTVNNCIFSSNYEYALNGTVSGLTAPCLITNNTFYGAENKLGTGVYVTGSTAALYVLLKNNIIYGFSTGVNGDGLRTGPLDDYNDYYNNTNDVNNATYWQKGPNDITSNPQFVGVSQLTGSTATTSGSVLTQSGADFSSVVDGQDFVYLKSGSGVTTGIYGITAHTTTTLTLDIAPGTNATADKVWQITTGNNYAIGKNLKGTGYPGTFAGGLTTGYMDIGAIQRREGSETAYTFVSG